jgi:hypothetical protein
VNIAQGSQHLRRGAALPSSAQLAAAILPSLTSRLGPQWDLQHSSQEPIRFAEIDIGQR